MVFSLADWPVGGVGAKGEPGVALLQQRRPCPGDELPRTSPSTRARGHLRPDLTPPRKMPSEVEFDPSTVVFKPSTLVSNPSTAASKPSFVPSKRSMVVLDLSFALSEPSTQAAATSTVVLDH